MRFLVDGMLGNMTRWLRLLGHDVAYENLSDDNELLLRTRLESRILLTADVELFRLAKRRGLQAVLAKGNSVVENLSKLSKKLTLPLVFDQTKSRCPACGSPLSQVPKSSIEGRVPKRSYQKYDKFWICLESSCSKVYWRGSHWPKIEQTLNKAKE